MTEELISWSDDLSVGIQEVDKQHKHLVELLNNLHRAIREHHGSSVARDMLRDLTEYTRVHFATEESLMQASSYPEYDSHKVKHEALIQQVVALQKKVAAGETGISFELLHFLKNWLTQHIQVVDKQFGAFFIRSMRHRTSTPDTAGDVARAEEARHWWKFWQ